MPWPRDLLLVLVCFPVLCACAPADKPSSYVNRQTISIAAAADLKFALPAIIEKFRAANPSIEVVCTFGASGNFVAQISNGAPFDLFLSADRRYPDQLRDQGLAHSEPAFLYAVGHLVIWTRNDSSLQNESLTCSILESPKVNKISIANPNHAPYGRAAKEALQHSSIWEGIESKIVIGENVAQAAQFAETGASDVAIIAQSLAVSTSMQKVGRFEKIPEDWYSPIEQFGILLKKPQAEQAAMLFRDFLLTEEASKILEENGLGIPTATRDRDR